MPPSLELVLWLEVSRDSFLRVLATVSISFHWVLGVPISCWELGWCSTCCRAANSYSGCGLVDLPLPLLTLLELLAEGDLVFMLMWNQPNFSPFLSEDTEDLSLSAS